MILVTRLGHKEPLVLNADLIRRIEAVPDTTITLSVVEVIVVAESVDVIVALVIAYKREIHAWSPGRQDRPQ